MPDVDPARIQVWQALAEHFLDTETRHALPLTALTCVEAGLTLEQAHQIWNSEVVPAVGANLLSLAGEWAGWDEAWLVERMAVVQHRSALARWLGFIERHAAKPYWQAIAACMHELTRLPTAEREQRARDLSHLARLYFDFACLAH